MKATTSEGMLQLTISLLDASALYNVLPNGNPVKAVLGPLLGVTPPFVDLMQLLATFHWNGSSFPMEDCFDALKGHVPESERVELRRLIGVRARKHNSTLE